jgi:enoyl-CoA hydratase/carnithine racemase
VHKKVLSAGSRDLLAEIERRVPRILQGWVLAGGTALALHFGHRLSEDFDFFKTAKVDLGSFRMRFGSWAPARPCRRRQTP